MVILDRHCTRYRLPNSFRRERIAEDTGNDTIACRIQMHFFGIVETIAIPPVAHRLPQIDRSYAEVVAVLQDMVGQTILKVSETNGRILWVVSRHPIEHRLHIFRLDLELSGNNDITKLYTVAQAHISELTHHIAIQIERVFKCLRESMKPRLL